MKLDTRLILLTVIACLLGALPIAWAADVQKYDYRVLATNKTSTMEREMNQAALDGYRFGGTMGGETAFGGNETVTIMVKAPVAGQNKYEYKLLATKKTSTMQKEIQQAAESGFEYKGQSVFQTTFGGKEVVVIMERDSSQATQAHDYLLLATSKTSTMQKELAGAGESGYEIMGVTVAETSFGGQELVAILRRPH